MTGKKCPVGQALEALGAEAEEVQAILDNGVTSVIISQWFEKVRGFKGCSTAAVNRHRRSECECAP